VGCHRSDVDPEMAVANLKPETFVVHTSISNMNGKDESLTQEKNRLPTSANLCCVL